MIKAIIFGLNGVFIRSPYLSNRFEKKLGIQSFVFERVDSVKNLEILKNN